MADMRSLLLILAAASLAIAQDPKPDTTTYYLLESVMSTPAGKALGTSVSLVKRVTQPAKGTIEETVLSLRGTDPAREFVTLIRPQGSKLTISGEGFDGAGELSGPEWSWSGMQFTIKMTSPNMVIEGKDEFAPDRMSAIKRMLGPDAQVRTLIRENGPAIPAAVYEVLRSRLGPK
jgi:hypothetical protein